MRRTALVGLCAFLVGAIAGTGVANQAASSQPAPLAQPSGWVAFQSDVIQTSSEGIALLESFIDRQTGPRVST
jgi:hypothetical protein